MEDISALKKADSWAKSAVILAVTISLSLIALKLYGWYATESLSILSSLTDSLMDILVSGLNLFAIYYAVKPADEDHRFGHRSIEDIAGLFQAAMLAGTTLLIIFQSIARFFNPIPASETISTGYNIMIISLVLTFILVIYQKIVILKSKSIIVEADHYHYLSDLLVAVAIILSLYAWDRLGIGWIDPLLAIVIVLIIAHGAFKIGKRSFNNIMDRELEDSEKEKIISVLKQAKQDGKIIGYHDLRTRCSGQKVFVQLHMDIDKNLSFSDAHQRADEVEKKIKSLFMDADVIVHEDPV